MFPKTGSRLPGKDQGGFAPAIAEALKAELGQGHRAAKTVMRWTGASERSAKNWLSGARAPTGWHLILLASRSEGVARAFLTLAGRTEFTLAVDLLAARRGLVVALAHIDAALNGSST